MKVKIKSTSEIGYVVKEDGDMLYLRIPSDRGFPFSNYAYIHKNRTTPVKTEKKPDLLEELGEALF